MLRQLWFEKAQMQCFKLNYQIKFGKFDLKLLQIQMNNCNKNKNKKNKGKLWFSMKTMKR